MKKLILITVLMILASMSFAATSSLESNIGISGRFAEIPQSARASGMANACMALIGGAEAVFVNPAGTSSGENSMYFSHDSWVSGVLQESISFATTVPVVGRLGGGISYIDEGTIESYSVDSSGTPVKVPNINPYGLVLKINWSKDVYHGLVLGVNASFLKEKLGTEEPFAAACDIGMQYKGLVPGLCLAIVTRNIGMEIKGYKIDKSINAGIGYEKEVAKGNKIAAEVDFKGEIDGPFTGAAGVEYVLNKTLSLRAGYELDRTGIETGLKGIRAGAGLQFKGVTLDYGYEPYGDLGVAHKISLGMNF